MVCNQNPPVADTPSLMTFREVETLFHEFGHALQHMLTTEPEGMAAGINLVEWDAVEQPSQFMENWCYDKATIDKMAFHYQTGEPIPKELFEKLLAAKTYRAASMMLRQVHFSLVDLSLHTSSKFDPKKGGMTAFDLDRKIGETTEVMAPQPYDRFLCSFSHIFAGGYAAGYYSYKWAEILSADDFGAFEDAGLDNDQAVRKIGAKFRETVLGMGGGRNPSEVFREFRGRDPTPEALLKHTGLLQATTAPEAELAVAK
jgi:oligopeptidase A